MAELPQTAGELNITLLEGTDFTLPLTWTSGGSPVDLTGYSAAMQLRPSANDIATPLLSLTHTSGITLGGVAGTITIEITKAQNVFGDSRMVYDLELTDSLGKVTRLIEGTVVSKAEVTK